MKNKLVTDVNIVNFDVPFGNMIYFMFKWAFASVPAAVALWLLFTIGKAAFTSIAAAMIRVL